MNIIQASIFLYKKIEKIIFPQCCLKCGKIAKDILCNKCKKDIYYEIDVREEKNIKEGIYFNKLLYIFDYKGIIRSLILDYKFNDKSYLYKIFSKIIIKNEKICGNLKKYDIIIPVPIHKKRRKTRGYNQSELISKEIAKNISNIKYENKVIIKEKNNVKQSSLSKEKRIQNVKNVYKIINKEIIKNKKIIIFDDIYTTGNTVNEIAKILKENGAKSILVLVIAKD